MDALSLHEQYSPPQCSKEGVIQHINNFQLDPGDKILLRKKNNDRLKKSIQEAKEQLKLTSYFPVRLRKVCSNCILLALLCSLRISPLFEPKDLEQIKRLLDNLHETTTSTKYLKKEEREELQSLLEEIQILQLLDSDKLEYFLKDQSQPIEEILDKGNFLKDDIYAELKDCRVWQYSPYYKDGTIHFLFTGSLPAEKFEKKLKKKFKENSKLAILREHYEYEERVKTQERALDCLHSGCKYPLN